MREVILHSYRYYAPVSDECESLEDAIIGARYFLDFNEACPDRVTDPDGNVLLTHEQLREAMEALPEEKVLR